MKTSATTSTSSLMSRARGGSMHAEKTIQDFRPASSLKCKPDSMKRLQLSRSMAPKISKIYLNIV